MRYLALIALALSLSLNLGFFVLLTQDTHRQSTDLAAAKELAKKTVAFLSPQGQTANYLEMVKSEQGHWNSRLLTSFYQGLKEATESPDDVGLGGLDNPLSR